MFSVTISVSKKARLELETTDLVYSMENVWILSCLGHLSDCMYLHRDGKPCKIRTRQE